MYRYMDNGKRFGPGKLSGATATPFDKTDTITILPRTPAADMPPQYPQRTSRSG